MSVRRGACEAQALLRKRKRLFPILVFSFGGRTRDQARVAGVLVGHGLTSQRSMPLRLVLTIEAQQRNGSRSQPTKIAARKTSADSRALEHQSG